MSSAALKTLGELIHETRDTLLARWRDQVRKLPSAQHLDTPTLNDHIPDLIEELADALRSRTDQPVDEKLLAGSPPVHGRQRLRDGFDIEEVVAEYNILRRCIHELADQQGVKIQSTSLHVVNDVLDEAIGLAVQTYATQRALEVQKHREEHVAFIVHDLRTPLNAISISAKVLELTLHEHAKDAGTEQVLSTLQRNIQHLEELVGKVLKENTSDSPAAASKLVCRTVDLWPLVEAVKEDLKPIAATASAEIVNRVPGNLIVYADAGLLIRVFQNLIANAINYTPRGMVIIEAHQCDEHGTVECCVSDNGSGIPPALLTKVFDKYETDSQREDGCGLGLAIVKELVEAHGGTIFVESVGSVGSKFRFTLPARP
jgi:two-component system, OmpR family, phosphate regulon sensor histidine kinase PhoR